MQSTAGQSGVSCTTSRFTYNGDGLRATRVSSRALDMRYVWDVAGGLPVILRERDLHNTLDGHGTDNTYVYGLDLISVTDLAGAQKYFLYDGLGSTATLTDGSGNTTATYSYDVFGAIRSESGAGAAANEWRFTGEQDDRLRNFYYLRARYYDPAIGRFLTPDLLGCASLPPQSLHRYAYVNNNPINRVDPTGLVEESIDAGGEEGFIGCMVDCACPSVGLPRFIEVAACGAFYVAFTGLCGSLCYACYPGANPAACVSCFGCVGLLAERAGSCLLECS